MNLYLVTDFDEIRERAFLAVPLSRCEFRENRRRATPYLSAHTNLCPYFSRLSSDLGGIWYNLVRCSTFVNFMKIDAGKVVLLLLA